jgi:hypothetical protein
MMSIKYGIKTPYCDNEITNNKLIGDLLYYFDNLGINRVDNIDIENIFKNLTINFNITNNYESSHYTHVQSVPSVVWIVTHNLGFNPVVAVYDPDGHQVDVGVEITIPNVSLKLFLNNAIMGIAECSI